MSAEQRQVLSDPTEPTRAMRALRAKGIDPMSAHHLRCVIEAGDASALSLILQAGQSPDTPFWDGHRPIDFAIQKKQPELARLLIEAGAALGPPKPVVGMEPPAPPLEHALLLGDQETSMLLLAAGAYEADEWKTLLQHAAFSGLLEPLEILLLERLGERLEERAAGTDELDEALFFACAGGRESVVRALAQRGASLVVRENGSTGLSSMLRAIERQNAPRASAYRKALGARCESLFDAIVSGGLRVPLSQDVLDGALRTAVFRVHETRTHALLAAGADPGTTASLEEEGRSLMEAALRLGREHGATALFGAMRASGRVPASPSWLVYASTPVLVDLLLAGGLQMTPDARLCRAARARDLEELGAALDEGADPNVDSGPGPLLYECVESVANPRRAIAKDSGELAERRRGFFSVVERLLAAGADPSAEGRNGMTALAKATWYALDEFSFALLAAGASVQQGTNQRTPLHGAARHGQMRLCEALLAAGVAARVADETGQTALFLASARGHLPVVERLLATDADPNVVTSNGSSALGLAVWNGHLDVVRVLCAGGADPNLLNAAGESVVSMAVDRGRGDEYMSLLFAAGAGVSGFVYGNPLVVRRYEQGGASDVLVAQGRKGRDASALLACAISGDLEGLERILREAPEGELGLRGVISFGRSVLDYALRYGQVETATRLHAAGSALSAASLTCALQAPTPDALTWLVGTGEFHAGLMPRGDRPMRSAVHSKSGEVMQALLDHLDALGIPDECAQHGADALRLAAYGRSKGIIEVLLAAGVHPDTVAYGAQKSALMEAIDRSATDCARVLIAAGASLGPSSFEGRTPLIEAATDGNAPLVEELIALGSDLDHRDDKEGLTALEWAAKYNRAEALAILETRGQPVVNAWAHPTEPVLRALAEQLDLVSLSPGDHRVRECPSEEALERRILLTERVVVAKRCLPEHVAPRGTWLEAIVACNRQSRSHGLPEHYGLELDPAGTVQVTSKGGGYRLLTEAEWEVAVATGLFVPEEPEWVFDLFGERRQGFDRNPREPRTIDRSRPVVRVLRGPGPRVYSPESLGLVRLARGELGTPFPRRVDYTHVLTALQQYERAVSGHDFDEARRIWETALELFSRYFGSEMSALSELRTLKADFGPLALATLARRRSEAGLRFAFEQGASARQALPDGRTAEAFLVEPDGTVDEGSVALLARVGGSSGERARAG